MFDFHLMKTNILYHDLLRQYTSGEEYVRQMHIFRGTLMIRKLRGPQNAKRNHCCASIARIVLIATVINASGCYVVPAEKNDFSELPDDSLSAPVKKYVRSWDAALRVDLIESDLQKSETGRATSEFQRLISAYGGSCNATTTTDDVRGCSAEFTWKVWKKDNFGMPVNGTGRLCLSYQLTTAAQRIVSIRVKATCFRGG